MAIIGDKNIKELVGKVVSDKNNKTIVVAVDRVKMHPLYKKRYTTTKRYYVHDEENIANQGDIVKLRLGKPKSKTKKWYLIEIIERFVA